jgi:beta-alanine--pyruvate transaminase
MITFAKGVSSGYLPVGGVVVSPTICAPFWDDGTDATFKHGLTYSGHATCAAAALANLDVFAEEKLFDRARELAPYFENAVHALRELPHVIDVRNLGLVAGIELEPVPGKPAARAFEVFRRCFEKGVLIRTTGDIIALSPPLIISKAQIDALVGTLADVLRESAR